MLARRARKNVFYKILAQVVPRGLTLLFFAYAARKLGTADFGKLSFAIQYGLLFAALVDPGLNTLFVRDVAGHRDITEKYLAQFSALKILLAGGAYLLALATIWVLDYSLEMVKLVALAALIPITLQGLEYVGAVLTSWEQIHLEALVNFVDRFLLVALAGGALWLGYGVLPVCAVILAVRLSSLALGLLILHLRIGNPRPRVSFSFWRRTAPRAAPLAALLLLTTIYVRVDIVMLSLLGIRDSEIGWYAASMKIVDVVASIPFMFVAGLFPIFSDLHKNEPHRLNRLCTRSLKILLMLACPVAVGGYFSAREIIHLLYGSTYEGATALFQLLVWRLLFTFPNLLFVNVLIAADQEKFPPMCAGLGVAINVGMNALLIPRYGAVGAAATAVVTDVAVCLSLCYFMRSSVLATLERPDNLCKPFLGAAIMGAVLWLLGSQSLFLLTGVGIVVYGGTQLVLRTVTPEELYALRERRSET